MDLSAPALVLIDIQKGMDDLTYWGNRNNPGAEANAACLLEKWRELSWPVIHVKHNSTHPSSRLVAGQEGNDFKEELSPRDGEIIIEKNVNSAFIGTDLQQRLEISGIKTLVMAGLTIEHCVSSTVRMGANLGFQIILAGDATAAFDKQGPDGKKYLASDIHANELACLNGEFAEVLTTKTILLRYC